MSLKSILMVILIGAAVVIGAIFVMHWSFPQMRNVTQPCITFLTETAPAYAIQGWQWIAGSLAVITPIAIGLWAKFSQAKAQATALKTQADTVISSVTAEKDKIQAALTSANTKITDLEAKLTTATATPPQDDQLLASLKSQVTNLQGQVQGVQEQSTQFVRGLQQAANGALITGPDGKIYSVLKVDPVILVK